MGLGQQFDPAELVVLAVEGERLVAGPRLHDHVVGLAVLVPRERWDLPVAEVGVHRGADGESGDESPPGDDVEHRELLGHANRRVVARDRVADHAERGPRRAPRQRRRDQVRRRHQSIAVLVVLVAADAVEAERLRVLELVEVRVVDVVAFARVVQRAGDVHPDRPVPLAEVLGQVRPRHQVEPGELHGLAFVSGHPSHSHTPRPITHCRSSPFSHGRCSVKRVMHS